jgi:hypothetical protein
MMEEYSLRKMICIRATTNRIASESLRATDTIDTRRNIATETIKCGLHLHLHPSTTTARQREYNHGLPALSQLESSSTLHLRQQQLCQTQQIGRKLQVHCREKLFGMNQHPTEPPRHETKFMKCFQMTPTLESTSTLHPRGVHYRFRNMSYLTRPQDMPLPNWRRVCMRSARPTADMPDPAIGRHASV